MCRIAGLIDKRRPAGLNESDKQVLSGMTDSLAHGGPDGQGFFVDRTTGLGHRRLAIIDLSDAGIQPMTFGKWTISFNGEIYNYQIVKDELVQLGYEFVTHTDTEVIVKAFDKWGVSALKRFRGMFAFALWNAETQTLAVCRDRVGVKPLYWYCKDGLFMFASEVKAFHKHPDFDKEINLKAIPFFLQKGYIHPSESIFKHVHKVEAGTVLFVNSSLDTRSERYWDVEPLYYDAEVDKRPFNVVAEELEKVLEESFAYRMVADVPVGIFLSGGIDSSLVTAMLQKNSSTPLKTFTIGFTDPKFNEAGIAARTAAILGTQHTSIDCTESDMKEILPLLPKIYDEPFADNSAIPTILVSRLAARDVKVVLSGDGGDELFGGYSKYHFSRYAGLFLNTPRLIRSGIQQLLRSLPPQKAEAIAEKMGFNGFSQIGSKYYKMRQVILADSFEDFFERSSSYFTREELANLANVQKDTDRDIQGMPVINDRRLSYLGMKDILSYLPGDILTKVDRASMSVALEAREPFLDQNVIEFAMRLPDNMKYDKEYKGKYLLKYILNKYLPAETINRPKYGFTIPVETWLNSVLHDNIIEMTQDTGFLGRFELDAVELKRMVDSFFAGKGLVNPHQIWFVYCLFQWYKEWLC